MLRFGGSSQNRNIDRCYDLVTIWSPFYNVMLLVCQTDAEHIVFSNVFEDENEADNKIVTKSWPNRHQIVTAIDVAIWLLFLKNRHQIVTSIDAAIRLLFQSSPYRNADRCYDLVTLKTSSPYRHIDGATIWLRKTKK